MSAQQSRLNQIIPKYSFLSSLSHFECGDGWISIIEPLCNYISRFHPSVKAVQCKEKFGGLRIYYEDSAPHLDDSYSGAISFAEYLCDKMCEECGAPGITRTFNHYVKTECDLCHILRQESFYNQEHLK
jgi:hypothetical protein